MLSKPKSPVRKALETLGLRESLTVEPPYAVKAHITRNNLQRNSDLRFEMVVHPKTKARTFTRIA